MIFTFWNLAIFVDITKLPAGIHICIVDTQLCYVSNQPILEPVTELEAEITPSNRIVRIFLLQISFLVSIQGSLGNSVCLQNWRNEHAFLSPTSSYTLFVGAFVCVSETVKKSVKITRCSRLCLQMPKWKKIGNLVSPYYAAFFPCFSQFYWWADFDVLYFMHAPTASDVTKEFQMLFTLCLHKYFENYATRKFLFNFVTFG